MRSVLCSSCSAETGDDALPEAQCSRCGAALWRAATTTELDLLSGSTRRIEEHLPAAGRRPADQLDGVINAHLADDAQPRARDPLHRALKALPLHAGERVIWVGRCENSDKITESGGFRQIRCDYLLFTSQRLRLGGPTTGRGRHPTLTADHR
jgi:hypothetical protein